ncbi:MAG: hypothetical protein AAF471_02440 [Myxococcota bacterium]
MISWWIPARGGLPKSRDAMNRVSTNSRHSKMNSRPRSESGVTTFRGTDIRRRGDSCFRGLPKRSAGCFCDERLAERSKMDPRLRGDDKVGGSSSNVDENACSAKDNTLLLSFPRRRESIEKASNSRLTDFLEIPFRGNDRERLRSSGLP